MKKSRTATPRLLLCKERIRILAQADFTVVDGGDRSTGSKETELIAGDLEGPLKHWLSTPRYVREFGSVYIAQNTASLRPFPGAMSAVVVLQHAAPSTPTPTGMRKVTK